MHSHILTNFPRSAARRGCARFVDAQFAVSARLAAVSNVEMRERYGVLHALLCTFYYRESVETIKNGRASRLFFLFCLSTMNHPPALLSTGGRLCRTDGKGKRFFFPLLLPTLRTLFTPRRTQQHMDAVRLLVRLPSPPLPRPQTSLLSRS